MKLPPPLPSRRAHTPSSRAASACPPRRSPAAGARRSPTGRTGGPPAVARPPARSSTPHAWPRSRWLADQSPPNRPRSCQSASTIASERAPRPSGTALGRAGPSPPPPRPGPSRTPDVCSVAGPPPTTPQREAGWRVSHRGPPSARRGSSTGTARSRPSTAASARWRRPFGPAPRSACPARAARPWPRPRMMSARHGEAPQNCIGPSTRRSKGRPSSTLLSGCVPSTRGTTRLAATRCRNPRAPSRRPLGTRPRPRLLPSSRHA